MATLRTQPHWDHPRKEYDILTTPFRLFRQVARRARRFFFGATRVLVPNPTDEPNRCKLKQETPRRPWKPLYLGFFRCGRPL